MKLFVKNYGAGVMYLILAFAPLQADHISTIHIFDPLFPTTPFKKVLTSCMKARNAIELIHEYKAENPGSELIIDTVVAKLTYLQNDLDMMLKHGNSYTFTDIEYLLNIIDCISAEIKHTAIHDTNEHMPNIIQMVSNIKNKLENSLDT